MIVQVAVPPVGESIQEGVLVEWLKKDGEAVHQDDPLFVLETDKVTMTINATAAGRLKTLVAPGETVAIGQAVGELDTEAKGTEAPAPAVQAAPQPAPPPPTPSPTGPMRAEAPAPAPAPSAFRVPQTAGPPLVTPAGGPQAREKLAAMGASGFLSPAVRRLVEEHRLEPSAIAGTGKDGRLTKEDVLRHMDQVRRAPPAAATAAVPVPPLQGGRTEEDIRARQSRVAMTPLRARIAERLVAVKNTTAMLTTFNEVDMSNVMALREKYRAAFKEKHGVDLGFMSFFVKASVEALKAVPEVNAQIQGNEIVRNHYYDIGVAVSSERGLVVPVLRDADRLSFAETERAIGELARRVRERAITLGELTGGVFTVSNGGVYGNLLSTPILNPPQSAILGMHAIKKRPVVVDDQVVARPMMYLAVSYDHRLVDGREAVTFLKHIVGSIENPGVMLLDI